VPLLSHNRTQQIGRIRRLSLQMRLLPFGLPTSPEFAESHISASPHVLRPEGIRKTMMVSDALEGEWAALLLDKAACRGCEVFVRNRSVRALIAVAA
jgi:hypothetical protein